MEATHLGTKRHIFQDAFRKRVWTLKDHANPLPEGDDIPARLINILGVECDSSFNTSVRDEFVQPVESPEKSRFPTSRGPDQSSDLAVLDNDVNIFKGEGRTIIEMESLRLHLCNVVEFYHGEAISATKILRFT
jgi:hypothetical protein